MRPAQIVEAVLFASDAPLRAEEIARADVSLDEDVVEEAIQELRRDYDDGERSFEIREVAGGYQIMTKPEFAPYLERFDTVPRPSRLSGPALETLAIIAYRQPIGRIEIEYIRGVGSSGVIRTLQDRGLVEVVGRAEGLGRPLLYGTGARFLEHFGFRSLEDLPRPEELPVVLRDRAPLGVADEEGMQEEPSVAERETAGDDESFDEAAVPAGAVDQPAELALEGSPEETGAAKSSNGHGPLLEPHAPEKGPEHEEGTSATASVREVDDPWVDEDAEKESPHG